VCREVWSAALPATPSAALETKVPDE